MRTHRVDARQSLDFAEEVLIADVFKTEERVFGNRSLEMDGKQKHTVFAVVNEQV